MRPSSWRSRALGAFMVSAATAAVLAPATASASSAGTAVFTSTNAASGNAVVSFTAGANGALRKVAAYPTGGRGTGAGLGSQGALALTSDGSHLLAVNAGSGTVTIFGVDGTKLRRLGSARTGTGDPISVTTHGALAYVLDAAGSGDIVGYRITNQGLSRLAGSLQRLPSGTAGPAQVSFSPNGNWLVVTAKTSNTIDTFPVRADGRPGRGRSNPSVGATPFGFSFGTSGELLVSDAAGGPAGTSAVTSYAIGTGGRLRLLSGPVGTTQKAACWLVNSGGTAWTTNTGSGTLSSVRVSPTGRIALTHGVAATIGGAPIDAALASGATELFVLDSGSSDAIFPLRVRTDGILKPGAPIGGLPASAVGLAAS